MKLLLILLGLFASKVSANTLVLPYPAISVGYNNAIDAQATFGLGIATLNFASNGIGYLGVEGAYSRGMSGDSFNTEIWGGGMIVGMDMFVFMPRTGIKSTRYTAYDNSFGGSALSAGIYLGPLSFFVGGKNEVYNGERNSDLFLEIGLSLLYSDFSNSKYEHKKRGRNESFSFKIGH